MILKKFWYLEKMNALDINWKGKTKIRRGDAEMPAF